MNTPKQTEYPLTAEERAPIDEITAQLLSLTERRTGMLLLMARLKGLSNSAIDYRDGVLISIPKGENA